MHGAGTVTLSAVRRDGQVELHVSDEGPGFPAGFATRAFDRFSRADEARRAAAAGSASRSSSRSPSPTAARPASRPIPERRRLDLASGRAGRRLAASSGISYFESLSSADCKRLLERLARVGRARDALDVRALRLQELLAEVRERLRHDVLRAVGVVAVVPAEIGVADRLLAVLGRDLRGDDHLDGAPPAGVGGRPDELPGDDLRGRGRGAERVAATACATGTAIVSALRAAASCVFMTPVCVAVDERSM